MAVRLRLSDVHKSILAAIKAGVEPDSIWMAPDIFAEFLVLVGKDRRPPLDVPLEDNGHPVTFCGLPVEKRPSVPPGHLYLINRKYVQCHNVSD